MKTVYMILMVFLLATTFALCADMSDDQMSTQSDQMDQQSAQTNEECAAMDQGVTRATVQAGPIVASGLPASADVYIDGKYAMRIASTAGGMAPMQRAQTIADRLNMAFANGATWQDMRVAQVGKEWTVSLNGQLIATADSISARAFGMTPARLANNWASQTVVAMGGQPQTIAMQLQPAEQQVAGTQQQVGAMATWSNTPTKTVPLLNAASGTEMGSVMVAGSQSALDQTNAVVVYQNKADNGAMIWTFVPVTNTSTSDTLTRVNGVGLVSVPQPVAQFTDMQTGNAAMGMVCPNASKWNSMINTSLANQNLRFGSGAVSKIVPLYSPDSGEVVGGAQVVGSASAVAQTKSVAVTCQGGNMWQFAASSSTSPTTAAMNPVNNVVVSSLILAPKPAATTPAPSTTEPSTTQPEATTPPATTPPATTPGETQPTTPPATTPEETPTTP